MGSGLPPAASYHKPIAFFAADLVELIAENVPLVVVTAPECKKEDRTLVFFDKFKKIPQGNFVIPKIVVKTIAACGPGILPVRIGFAHVLATHKVVDCMGGGVFTLIFDGRHLEAPAFVVKGFFHHQIESHIEELPLGAHENPRGAKGKDRRRYFLPRQQGGITCPDVGLPAVFGYVGRGEFGIGTDEKIVLLQKGDKLIKLAFDHPVGPRDEILCRGLAFYHARNVVKSLEEIVKLRGFGQFLKEPGQAEEKFVAPVF
jgi:hypothetical protein